MRRLIFLALFAITAEVAAQTFEPVLIPIAFRGSHPSTYGAIWETELVVHNTSDEAVRFYPRVCGDIPCPELEFRPHTSWLNPPISYMEPSSLGPPGRFLLLERSGADRVAISLHLKETTRSHSFGTEMPVVRESDALTGTVELLNIPTDVSYRQTLRIYDFDARPVARFHVRVYGMHLDGGTPEELLHEFVAETSGSARGDQGPIWAGYFVQDRLTDLFPLLRTVDRLRIEVEPIDGGRFWVFVSVTDPVTYGVTIFSP